MTVTDLDDGDDADFPRHLIDDPVIADARTIVVFVSLDFLYACLERISCKASDCSAQASDDARRESTNVLEH